MDDALARDVVRLVSEAAGEVRRLFYSREFNVSSKGKEGPLSTADILANEILVQGLRRLDPDSGILSEESADDNSRLRRASAWIIDPIDGTREFVAGVPEFAVSVGRVENGRAVYGVVGLPAEDRIVAGGSGRGVLVYDLSGREESPGPPLSQKKDARGCTVLISRSEYRRGKFASIEQDFLFQPQGSIARKLALLSAGTGDLVVSFYPKNDWDICGGVALVLGQTDGTVVDLRVKSEHVFNSAGTLSFGLVGGPKALVSSFLEYLAAHPIEVSSTYG